MAIQSPINGHVLADALGGRQPATDDPAFQPPRDPLLGVDLPARASVVHRDIPIVTTGTAWDVRATRNALADLALGLFDAPAQLVDSVVGDSRVQAAMASRTGGILGRPVDFVLPRKHRDSAAARECRDAFVDAWPTMAAEPILSQIQSWAVMLGLGAAQILWDTSGEYAVPHPRPWHPKHTYFHWVKRCHMALTMDGETPITPGDGQWLLHAPHGEYRGWMHGAVRAIAPWWLARNYALRDWARYSERHGLPMIKAMSPAVTSAAADAAWRAQLATLGQETVIHLPQGVGGHGPTPQYGYDVDLLEAKDTAHEGFQMLIRACDTEITLALLAQNLTTEIREGSMAAARVHADVRQALLEADARALAQTIYLQLARPFAAMNFGSAEVAPIVRWNVQPYEDNLTAVETLHKFAEAMKSLRDAGYAVEDVERLGKDFGLILGRLRATAPEQPGRPRVDPGALAVRFSPLAGVRVRIADHESEELRGALAEGEAAAAAVGRTTL